MVLRVDIVEKRKGQCWLRISPNAIEAKAGANAEANAGTRLAAGFSPLGVETDLVPISP
jgi:hypothetical protein